MLNGYRVAHKDEKSNLLVLDRPDESKCRGRRPVHDKFRNTYALQFGGRIKLESKKNAQVEIKLKLDGKVRAVL